MTVGVLEVQAADLPSGLSKVQRAALRPPGHHGKPVTAATR
jgi:hypothetical protein